MNAVGVDGGALSRFAVGIAVLAVDPGNAGLAFELRASYFE